jgi:predicted  nucleic acid-binding Zn-ribbon protein
MEVLEEKYLGEKAEAQHANLHTLFWMQEAEDLDGEQKALQHTVQDLEVKVKVLEGKSIGFEKGYRRFWGDNNRFRSELRDLKRDNRSFRKELKSVTEIVLRAQSAA